MVKSNSKSIFKQAGELGARGCCSINRLNQKAKRVARQIKIRRMMIMLMMIIIAAVVNFGEAKQQHSTQYGVGGPHRNQNPPAPTSTQIQSSYQCSIQKQYRPEGPIGIRYKKQILQGRDMRAEVQDSHMLEAALKKRHFLQMFGLEDQTMIEEDFQLQQLCPSFLYHSQLIDELTTDTFCGGSSAPSDQAIPEVTQNAFLSTHFYKPKYLHVQSTSRPQESLAQGGIQIQFHQAGDQQPKPQDAPRDNSYLNLALNVLPSYELPSQAIDALDNEQTIEGFLFKKAKQTNVDNFNMLRQVLRDNDHRLGSLEMFSRNSFTLEDPEFIANLTNGIKPIHIHTLKPQSSIYRYFTQEADITPQRTSFDECQLLIPKFEIIKITNKQRIKSIEIKTMIASSPELTFYPPGDLEFPFKLKAQESIEIKVAYISETLGLFEAVMYIVLDDYIFVSSFNAYVIPNQYEIYPFYVTDINVNQSIELPLHITNPSPTDTLIIEELYSTESDVKLKWPHTTSPISTSPDSADGDSVISHILVPEGGKKHLVNMVFEINRTMDFYVEIHIRTSLHDVLRVPLYYHVHSDVIKFTPNVIDFGMVPRNFDMLKIPIYARSKIQDPLIIQDVLLPIGDQRLDFQMVDFAKSQNHQTIRRNKDLFLGFALINPLVPGFVESKITVIVLGQRTNKTYVLDVPIIGLVHKSSDVFGANTVLNQNDPKLTYPLPLVSFDISSHILPTSLANTQVKEATVTKRKVNDQPNLKNGVLQTPLILRNNFKVPIKLKGIVNANPEIKVMLENPNHYMHGIILQPGQSIQYAQIELTTSLLKVSQGNKYISVIVNSTLIPVAISIFDRGLLCVWDQGAEQTIGLDDIPFCTNPYEINFDYVALNDIKVKRLKITNMNPVNVTIESVAKQQLDDLNVYIEKVIDKGGNQITIPSADLAGDTMQSIIGAKRTKRLINFIIQPYQTMQIVMQVLAKDPKQKFSRIDFQMKDGSSRDFSFNYKYHAIAGTLDMVPKVLKFNPSYPGMIQVKPLVARSTFEVPITVKTITSNDMRIIPTVQPIAIRPNNKTEFGALQFDSSKQPILNSMPTPHLGGPQGLPFNNHEIASILQQHIGSFDPQIQQNLMQILSGMGAGAASQGANVQQFQHHQIIHQHLQHGQHQIIHQHLQQGHHPSVQMINLPHKVHQMTQVMPLMTPQDIEIYRERQRMWEDTSTQNPGGSISMGPNSLVKEINTFVTIETNVFQNITIPIRAQIRKPTLTDTAAIPEPSPDDSNSKIHAEIIDFDYVQVGTSSMRNVKVINPTDEPFFFTLLLSPSKTYEKLIKEDKDSILLKRGPSSQDRDFYFKLFCKPKLELLKMSPPKDLTLPLTGRENFAVACQKIQIILESIANRENNDESVLTLRRRLEAYLKELHALESSQNEQQIQNQRQKETGFKDANLPFDIVLFEQELENITNTINQYSKARPLDQETLNIYRTTYEKQQKQIRDHQASQVSIMSTLYSLIPDMASVLSTTWNIIQAVALNKPSATTNYKLLLVNQTKQGVASAERKRMIQRESVAQKVPYYRLNNILLNDLIIKNDTSRLYKDKIKLADPFIVSYTGQSFFVNPRYQGQVYKVEARSMLTLKDAVIFQPQTLLDSYDMKLIIKNNLTQIQSVDLKGKSGSGFLEIIKVLKRVPGMSQDYYINAHMMYGATGLPLFNEIQANFIDYSNLSTNQQSQQQIKERLIQNVQADKDQESFNVGGGSTTTHLQQRQMLIRAAQYHRQNGYGSPNQGQQSAQTAFIMNSAGIESVELNMIPFHLGQEDIMIPLTEEEEQMIKANASQGQNDIEFDEDNEYVIVNRLLERAAAAADAENNPNSDHYQKIRYHIQTYHKRVLVVQNTGNLVINVENISLEDRGCQAQNFMIENCHPFILKPGETHKLHIGFRTDYTIAKFKRKLTLVSKQGVIQEYVLDVNIPVEHLKLANNLMPLTSMEEWYSLFLKFAILALSFTTFVQVALDVFSHLKFTQHLVPDHEESIHYLEENQSNFNIQLFRQLGTSLQAKRSSNNEFEKSLPPVIREQIPHDHVYHLYQQAQDKLLDNRATSLAGGKGSQLLLKEVANLCSNKRQLVTIEAQKQAIKFEYESRKIINARNQQYIREMKEEQAAQQQQKQQQQAKETPPSPIVQNQQQVVLQNASTYQVTSIISENTSSLNDSLQTIGDQAHISAPNQQELPPKQEEKVPKPSTIAAPQPKVISKKQQREIEKRQKEQLEAEERFRQHQKIKEMQEAALRQRQQELEETAKRIKAQEEERKLREQQEALLKKEQQEKIIENNPVQSPEITLPPVPVRHHQSEHEKRQISQKLNNKSLNTPSKDEGDSSLMNINSLKSRNSSTDNSQKSKKQQIVAAQPITTPQPEQDTKVVQNTEVIISPIDLETKKPPPSRQRFDNIIARNQMNERPVQSHRIVIDTFNKPKPKEEKLGQKAVTNAPPVVELDLRPQKPQVNMLSKEDLRPFIDQQERSAQPQDMSINPPQTTTSPLLNHFNGGSSIFSFNPLIMQGGNNSQNQTPDTQANKTKPQTLMGPIRHDFSTENKTLPSDFNANESEQEEEEEDDFQNQSAHLYSLFNTAKSLLARPSFGQDQTSGPKFIQKQKPTQESQKRQNMNETFNQKSQMMYSSQKNEEIQEEGKQSEAHHQGSLFSGSLFGETSIFASNQPKKQMNEQLYKNSSNNLPPSMFTSQGNNVWSSQQNYPPFNDTSFGNQGDIYGGTSQQSSALRRNQQQLYQENQGNFTAFGSGSIQNSGSYSSLNYQQQNQQHYPPPPGFGYKPQTQSQSLYAQYSSGYGQNQGMMGSQQSLGRISSLHFEPTANSGKANNNSFGPYAGANSSGGSQLHFSQSYPNQSVFGVQQSHYQQSSSNMTTTPPKSARVTQQLPPSNNMAPSQSSYLHGYPLPQTAVPSKWPQNPHLQGEMIQPPPGLSHVRTLDREYGSKKRNFMNTSSFFMMDEGQKYAESNYIGGENEESEFEYRRRIRGNFKNMPNEDNKEDFHE